jgi:phosphatidate phosphatase LPIN
LALRFEGRKASFLLVQQAAEAQAAEARAAEEARNEGTEYKVELAESSTLEESAKLKEDSEALGEAELPERVILIKDTEVIEDAERPGSVLLVKDTEAIADAERPEKVLLVKDTEVIEGAERPENVLLVKGTEVIREAEGSTSKEDKDVAGDAPDGLLASLAALRARNISVENENGASAIHTLLNRSVGLEETLQTGRPSTSLVAQAALAAVAKAAWEPGSVDSPKDLEKEYRDSFEVLNNSGDVIARGLRLRRSASLNLGSEPVAGEAISIRRVKSESDLRAGMKGIESESLLGLVESDLRGSRSEPDLRSCANEDDSSELSTLTITTADGVVVLHTPRGGSPPPSTIQDDHIQTLQQPIVYEGDGQEKPLVLGMLEFEQVVGDETKRDNPVEGPNPSPEKKRNRYPAYYGKWWMVVAVSLATSQNP